MIGLALLGLGLGAAGAVSSAIGAKKQAEAQAQAQTSANETNIQLARETNAFNSAEAAKQREFSSIEAQKSRDFEERMSNTAVSRRMADLKNAGINPLMAANGEATTPGGAVATGSSAQGVSARVRSVSDYANVAGIIGDTISNLGNTALKVAICRDMLGSKRFNNIVRAIK